MAQLEKVLCAMLEGLLAGRNVRRPDAGMELFDAFLALSRARTYHASGPNPITWQAMAAWSQMMRCPLGPHHARIIMALDNVWMTDAARRRSKAPDGVKTLPPVSKHPLNAALLDAVMG